MAFGMITLLFSKFRITVCLSVISSTIPVIVSLICILSLTRKGLNMIMNIPLTIFEKTCYDANPIATARIPAPASMELATLLSEGIAYIATLNPTI